jgi:hypothetical protein
MTLEFINNFINIANFITVFAFFCLLIHFYQSNVKNNENKEIEKTKFSL